MKPSDFPIGSPESRAAARAESERRVHIENETALVLFRWKPRPPRERTSIENQPGLSRYSMPDGSIVEVARSHWGEPGRTFIWVDQTWPDGRTYDGDCRVKSLDEVQRLGRLMSE